MTDFDKILHKLSLVEQILFELSDTYDCGIDTCEIWAKSAHNFLRYGQNNKKNRNFEEFSFFQLCFSPFYFKRIPTFFSTNRKLRSWSLRSANKIAAPRVSRVLRRFNPDKNEFFWLFSFIPPKKPFSMPISKKSHDSFLLDIEKVGTAYYEVIMVQL